MDDNILVEDVRQLIQELICEFVEDIGKRVIVLMGIPAAGKSTFINQQIKKYIPGFKGYKVSSSDVQLRASQFQSGKDHYNALKKDLSSGNIEKKIKNFILNTTYKGRRGEARTVPISVQWWKEHGSKGFNFYWKAFFKAYYATYFDLRDIAKAKEEELFKTKVIKAGDLLIYDTVAANPNKIFGRLEQTRKENFHSTIIYLEIDAELAIVRDKYREKTQGRGVGDNVIMNYAKSMDSAFKAYQQEGKKEDGLVDRLMHFIWIPQGISPIKGTWQLISDERFSLKRKLKKVKKS